MREAVHWPERGAGRGGAQRIHGKSLYLPLNFAVNLKLF